MSVAKHEDFFDLGIVPGILVLGQYAIHIYLSGWFPLHRCSTNFTAHKGDGKCIACDCNTEGSTSEQCDKATGVCDCIDGLASKAGIKCVSLKKGKVFTGYSTRRFPSRVMSILLWWSCRVRCLLDIIFALVMTKHRAPPPGQYQWFMLQ